MPAWFAMLHMTVPVDTSSTLNDCALQKGAHEMTGVTPAPTDIVTVLVHRVLLVADVVASLPHAASSRRGSAISAERKPFIDSILLAAHRLLEDRAARLRYPLPSKLAG